MCGRATLVAPVEAIAEALHVAPIFIGPPRFNLAPTQPMVIARVSSTGRELALARWGLVPWWSKDVKLGSKFIQARAETLATAPAFRDAFKSKRCLVVVDGFYEWSGQGKARKAHHVRLPTRAPFTLAGLWDTWKSPEGMMLESCAVVTTTARGVVATLHDRMPLVLDGDARERWLSTPPTEARVLLDEAKVSPEPPLVVVPVSRWVNDVRHDDPRCLEPTDPAGSPTPPAQTTLLFR